MTRVLTLSVKVSALADVTEEDFDLLRDTAKVFVEQGIKRGVFETECASKWKLDVEIDHE